MLIYGTGGHAKVVYDCLKKQGIKVVGFFDDRSEKKSFFELDVNPYASIINRDDLLVLAIGDNKIRKNIAGSIAHQFGHVVHPTAVISEGADIDPGSMILHQATIQIDCQIGKHVIINTMASVDHDCVIEDFVHIAPNATLCGNVKVGEGTLIGAGAVVIPGIKIGRWSVVGAGAVVTHDVPDRTVAAGNPAKTIHKNKHY